MSFSSMKNGVEKGNMGAILFSSDIRSERVDMVDAMVASNLAQLNPHSKLRKVNQVEEGLQS